MNSRGINYIKFYLSRDYTRLLRVFALATSLTTHFVFPQTRVIVVVFYCADVKDDRVVVVAEYQSSWKPRVKRTTDYEPYIGTYYYFCILYIIQTSVRQLSCRVPTYLPIYTHSIYAAESNKRDDLCTWALNCNNCMLL